MGNVSKFWEKAIASEKFMDGGLWGLKAPDGEIVLSPKYDQIEICSDFIYAHYDDRYTIFYKNNSMTDCGDEEDDYRFIRMAWWV